MIMENPNRVVSLNLKWIRFRFYQKKKSHWRELNFRKIENFAYLGIITQNYMLNNAKTYGSPSLQF